MRVSTFRFRVSAVLFALSLIVSSLPSGLASATTATPTVGGTALAMSTLLSANPSSASPQIPIGSGYSVEALASVGDVVYMGGAFPSVKGSNGTTYTRYNLAAYNAVTGAVSNFAPNIDGKVRSIAPSPDGSVLYVAGEFRNVNGVARRGLVAFNRSTGALISGFNARFTTGNVMWAEYTCGKLWVSGNIPGILRTLSPSTGANTGYQNLSITGTNKSGTPTKVERFDISPTCSEMVAIGNFTAVGGKARKQVFRLGLGSSHPAVSNWYNPAWNVTCHTNFPQYTRGVTYSPTGTYFTIATSGSHGPAGVTQYCDSLTRWSTSTTSASSSPVWMNKTGGDTLLSVADTGNMICAGGHQRWANNPNGRNRWASPAVASPGFTCLNAANGISMYVTSGGVTYRWNITRSRGIGASALLLMHASNGKKFMIIGSDTSGGGKLGCSQPGGNIDCGKPVNQPSVTAREAACTPEDNFVGCTGLTQETHAGVGQLVNL